MNDPTIKESASTYELFLGMLSDYSFLLHPLPAVHVLVWSMYRHGN